VGLTVGVGVAAPAQAYAYLHKRSRWMRYQSYRRQHLPIGSGITEAACKIVFTQRLKRSGMSWTITSTATLLEHALLAQGINRRVAIHDPTVTRYNKGDFAYECC
jgi:hypothetical protein